MNEPAIRQASANQRWPMTGEAWLTLVDELGQLRIDLAVLAEAGAPNDGVVHLPVFKAARRLDVLSAVLDAARQGSRTGPSRDRAASDAPRGGRRLGHLRVGVPWRWRSGPRLDLGRFTPRSRCDGLRPRRQGRGHGASRTASHHGPLGRVASRMLSYMTTPGTGTSPLAVAALALIRVGATAADLESRFSENGADLRPGIAEDLLVELEFAGSGSDRSG